MQISTNSNNNIAITSLLKVNVFKDITQEDVPVTDVVDNAVGVPERHWFIAIIHRNTEKKTAEKLTNLGIENYLPLQREIRIWKNGRKSKVDRVVISALIFIHCTEAERKEIVKLPYINRFMTNKAGDTSTTGYGKPLATVSDTEINKLRFMLGQSDIPVTITERRYRPGDKVRIVRGSLAGLEGEVADTTNGKSNGKYNGKSEVLVSLDFIGCASLKIDPINLVFINA